MVAKQLHDGCRKRSRSPETPSAEALMWKLAFRYSPQLPIFTGTKIEDADGNTPEIFILGSIVSFCCMM
ncbi:hypothetical protein GUJ93_ZPchr0006g45997 [Zizania palustris]|uniref:Uncharacterized protein n=1 Tax=Zizania palustris TaxID=103762 RepID=A0A8J5T2T8_ZIZPA|nr:hypothetical protein GUJ93_ZPchr0006g45997 [Zizania palustris]